MRRLPVFMLCVCIVGLLGALGPLVLSGWDPSGGPQDSSNGATTTSGQDGALAPDGQRERTGQTAQSGPFAPDAESGLIEEGHAASLVDEQLPAIANLDPSLRDALRQAAADAWPAGVDFAVTSGWRSPEYQQWLFDDAVTTYGSEEIARQFVATPDSSHHVTGDAVDIGPSDAQQWLIEHGSRYGLCQIYSNESWHFELATQPGGSCPALLPDAAG